MTEATINQKTGTADNPLHPCYKAPEKGLCRLRVYADSNFHCLQEPESCRYIKRPEKPAQEEKLEQGKMLGGG